MSYELIVKNNPNLKIYRVTDKEFIPYGKVLNNLSTDEIVEVANKIPMPVCSPVFLHFIASRSQNSQCSHLRFDCFVVSTMSFSFQ